MLTSTREGATQREQAAMAAEHVHSIAREKYDDCHYGNGMKNEEIRVTPFSAFVRADDDRSRMVPVEGRPYDDDEFCGFAKLPLGMVYSRVRVQDWWHEEYIDHYFDGADYTSASQNGDDEEKSNSQSENGDGE